MSNRRVVAYGYDVVPPAAPSLSVVSGPGNLGVGVYQYFVSFVSGFGASESASSSVSCGGGQVVVLLQFPSAEVVCRNIYRTLCGGTTFFLLVSLKDAGVASYVDNVPDGVLGSVHMPIVTPADSEESILGYLYTSKPIVYSSSVLSAPQVLTAEKNFIISAVDGQVFTLPVIFGCGVGQQIVVTNSTAAALAVLPAAGQTIASDNLVMGSVSGSVLLPQWSRGEFSAVSPTLWYYRSPATPVVSGMFVSTLTSLVGFGQVSTGTVLYHSVGYVVSGMLTFNCSLANGVNQVSFTIPTARAPDGIVQGGLVGIYGPNFVLSNLVGDLSTSNLVLAVRTTSVVSSVVLTVSFVYGNAPAANSGDAVVNTYWNLASGSGNSNVPLVVL